MTRRALLGILGWTISASAGCHSKGVFTVYECFWCKGAGTIRCTGCFGKGTTFKFDSGITSGRSQTCSTCNGSGRAKCRTCKGQGKLSNNPLAG